MDFNFTPKFKLLLIMTVSVSSLAYFKYIKKLELGWKIGLSLGSIMLAMGCFSASLGYSPEKVANMFLLLDDAPAGAEKMILIGHIFVLLGLMSLVDTTLNKIFKIKRK